MWVTEILVSDMSCTGLLGLETYQELAGPGYFSEHVHAHVLDVAILGINVRLQKHVGIHNRHLQILEGATRYYRRLILHVTL